MCPFLFVYLLKVSSMINSVRNAVLTILNKNNYGYISPADFNLLAQNAQMELFEEAFGTYNKITNAENVRMSGTQYADLRKPLSELLESFLVRRALVPKYLNNFYYPSEVTTGFNAYMVSKMMYYSNQLVYSVNTSVASFRLIDTSGDFINKGVKVGDIVTNTNTYQTSVVVEILSATNLKLLDDIFPTSNARYSIYDYTSYSELEKVNNNNIQNLVSSNLTGPSEMYPAYTLIQDMVTVYPTSIQTFGAIQADYFRFPKPPKWTYISLGGGEPAFDQSQPDYQDFELPLEDEYKLVTKILEYCGIVIRENDVTSYSMTQQQKTEVSFN